MQAIGGKIGGNLAIRFGVSGTQFARPKSMQILVCDGTTA